MNDLLSRIRITVLPERDVLFDALDSVNRFKSNNLTLKHDAALIERCVVNYIRHELTNPNYNKMVSGLNPDSHQAKSIKRRVLERIKEAYPRFAREVNRQLGLL